MTAAIPPDLLALGNLMADELEALAAAKCVPEICEDWLIIARCWRVAVARITRDQPTAQEQPPC